MPDHRKSIEEFLHDDSVGPATGIAKMFADLGCWKQAFRFPAEVSLRIMAGCASYHYIGDEHKKAAEIIRHLERRIPDTDIQLMIVNAVSKPTEKDRFTRLLYDWAWVANYKRGLLVDLDTQKDYFASKTELDWNNPELQELGQNHYTVLRRLMGASLSTGYVQQAQEYGRMIREMPGHERFSTQGHTDAVSTYLDNGGEKFLINRAAFKFGVNKYWWKTRIGTPKHPGRHYKAIEPFMQDVVTNPVTAIVNRAAYVGTIGLWAWFAAEYGPGIIETARATPDAAMQAVNAITNAGIQYVDSVRQDPTILLYPAVGVTAASWAIHQRRKENQ